MIDEDREDIAAIVAELRRSDEDDKHNAGVRLREDQWRAIRRIGREFERRGDGRKVSNSEVTRVVADLGLEVLRVVEDADDLQLDPETDDRETRAWVRQALFEQLERERERYDGDG